MKWIDSTFVILLNLSKIEWKQKNQKGSWYCRFNFVSQDGEGKRNFLKDINKRYKKLFYKQRKRRNKAHDFIWIFISFYTN